MLQFSMKSFVIFALGTLSTLSSCAAESKNDIHEYKLDNGLTLIVREDHRAPTVVNFIWYKVGSSYEPNGITGISHALEHMMFKGTPSHPDGNFTRIMAENGATENAMTYYDFTAYYQKLAADKLLLAFQMEADRMANLSLNESDFVKEIEVVKEERRMRTDNNPQMASYERYMALAFNALPYHNPVVGWPSDLQTLKIDDLRKWYKSWYAPNNATVVVVGDVKPDEVLKLAKDTFGKLKPVKLADIKPIKEIDAVGPRNIVVKLPAKLPFIIMGYNTPSAVSSPQNWEPYALEVLSSILDGGESSRFTKHLIREKQIVSTIQTEYDLYNRLSGLLTVMAIPTQGHTVNELKDAVLLEIKNLQDFLVDPKELARVKAQVIANNIYQQDSPTNVAQLIGNMHTIGLTWKEIDNYQKQVEAITAEQIQKVAKKYLNPDQLIVTVLEPQPLKSSEKQVQDQGVSNVLQ